MSAPLRQDARARLRDQVRREQDLVASVLAADARLAVATRKRDAVVASHDHVIAERRADVADALADYLEQAGVGLDRAAAVLGREKTHLARLIRERARRPGA